jgi:glucan exporter ATP-binding protein
MGLKLYLRGLAMIVAEGGKAAALAAASVALGLIALAEPILFGRVIDALASGNGPFDLILMWACIGLIGIFAGVVVAVAADRMAHRRRVGAMALAFERAITMPINFLTQKGSGAVVRTILSGTDALFSVWLGFMREHCAALISVLFLIPAAISLDGRMAAILGVLATVFVVLNVLVVRKTNSGQLAVERYHTELFGRVGDVIGNVTVVQSYSRLANEMQDLNRLMQQLLAAQYPVLNWWGLLTVLTRAAGTVTMLAVFGLGAYLSARGELSVGAIVSFVAFAGLLIGKLDQLSSFAVRVFQQAPILNSFFQLVDQRDDLLDSPDARPLERVEGRVSYRDVTFQHVPGQGVIDLNFEAAAGETIAVVGPTGAGKTTAVALLQRLRPLERGVISVDGIDICDITLHSLRSAIAVVFQDAGLFNRSIAENIRVGRPDATDDQVEQAARQAEAHDFIMRKPGGYGFVIGERGSGLSGGERQRLAVARAILKDAPILILDEATSALDSATEARIKRALDRLRKGRTTFIIAHRLSTVADADQILVMDQGRIAERGQFAELVAANGLFAHLLAQGGFTRPREEPLEEKTERTGKGEVIELIAS